jgi:8-oxo-dGTP pyrophosphatase MutT (NUDIX family)
MKVIGKRTLWEGKFIKTTLITYKDRKGGLREWEAVSRVKHNDVVVIIPITRSHELVLIRQFRPSLDSYVIELPAGLVGPEEDLISAGRRELIEETAHTSDSLSLLEEGVMSTGINTEKWRVLVAQNAEEVSPEILHVHSPDENEDIEVMKVPLENLYQVLEDYGRTGSEVDLRIFGLIELAKRKLPLL